MVTIKSGDKIVDIVRDMQLSYEDEAINIQISHPNGFAISVYDRLSQVMRFYEIVDGKLILDEEEQL